MKNLEAKHWFLIGVTLWLFGSFTHIPYVSMILGFIGCFMIGWNLVDFITGK